MRSRRIALGVGVNVVERALIAIMQIVSVPVLANHWGLQLYGTWSMLATVPGLLALGDLGFISASSVLMTMQIARGEVEEARATLHSATQIVLVACGIIGALVIGAALLLPASVIADVKDTDPGELRLALMILGAYAVLVLGCTIVQGKLRATQNYALGIVFTGTTFVLENGLLFAAVVMGYGLLGGAVAWVSGRAVGTLVQFIAAARVRPELFPGVRYGSAKVRGVLIRPALAAMSIPMGTAILLQGSVVALGAVAGAAAVPAFVAARTLSRIGLQGAQLVTMALMPEFGAASAVGSQKSVVQMLIAVLASALAISIPFALLLGFAGPWLVLMWSHGAIHAPRALMIAIAVSALCGGVWSPLSNLMLAVNRQSEFAIAYAILAVFAVALTFALGSRLHGTAAALGFAGLDVAMLVVVFRFVWRNWIYRNGFMAIAADIPNELRSILRSRRARG